MSENEEKFELDPGTFNLMDWVEGKNTYPRYTVKVHLDREAGRKLQAVADEINKARQSYDNIVKESEQKSGSGALTDAPSTESAKSADQILKTLKAKRSEYTKLEKTYTASELTLVFSVRDRSARKRIMTQLKEQVPELGELSQSDLQDRLTSDEDVAQAQMVEIIYETLSEAYNAKGESANLDKLDRNGIHHLLDTLSQDQLSKVFLNANQALVGGQEVDVQVDAGFPG